MENGHFDHKHGHCSGGKISKEYYAWCNMKRRCYEISHNRYQYYGGKGIKVCERWLEPKGKGFINFLEDMGLAPSTGHSLERKEVDQDYTKDNCTWATAIEQANNKTNNILIKHSDGRVYSLRRWCEMLSLAYKTEWNRLSIQSRSIKEVLGEEYEIV